MTSFHSSDRDLHGKDGSHKNRPPNGLDAEQRAAWRERMEKHMLRHDVYARPLAVANRQADPQFEQLSELCGRPLGRHFASVLATYGISQPEIAAELGVSTNGFKQKLAGKIGWQLTEVLYLCQRLNLNIHDVIAHLRQSG